MGNNPMNGTNPDGGTFFSTGVRDNGDGTFTVVNAKNDDNTGVFIADKGGN
jgi:hypothetical protein